MPRTKMTIPRFVLLCLLLFEVGAAVNWLSVGLASSRNPNRSAGSYCKELKGLTRKQLRFCRQNVALMSSIQRGAQSSYSECQYQFHKRRVTRDCAKGINENCGCDQTLPEHKQRLEHSIMPRDSSAPLEPTINEGCSDNVKYGNQISRYFVDAAEKKMKDANDSKSPAQIAVNMHNNRAGREALVSSLRRECKCHGISGSCEIKTCWQALPSFREIGTIIKDKFDGATEVQVILEDNKMQLKGKHHQFKRHTQADLLCCNRGFESRVRTVHEKCNCKFVYCCKVVCDTCVREVVQHFCL